jgi:serine/threonine protein kinase
MSDRKTDASSNEKPDAVRQRDDDAAQLPDDPYIGECFGGRYEIIERIGSGGVGLVYLAQQRELERDVVVKILDRRASQSESAHQRFLREAKGLSQFDHSHIVTVFDFGREGETPYLVMEYIDGIGLDELIAEYPDGMPMRLFGPIANQILDAVGEAHTQGVVHRDLKPSNIMLTERRGYPNFVKVLDFGLAKLLGDNSDVTAEDKLVGTIAYLSPEQIKGDERDERVDVYALGVVFYYMLTGQKPFRGEDHRVLYEHVNTSAPPLELNLPDDHDVPVEVIELVDLALRKRPDQRPRSAVHMRQRLLDSSNANIYTLPWTSGELSKPGMDRPSLDQSSDAWVDPSPTPSAQMEPTVQGVRPRSLDDDPNATAPQPVKQMSDGSQEDSGDGAGPRYSVIAAVFAVVTIGGFFIWDQSQHAASESSPPATSQTSDDEGKADEPSDPGPIVVTDDITGDTTWTDERDYVLDGLIYVEPGARLIIKAGTRVLGERGSALVVKRGGTLESRGTAREPVVFTSAQEPGKRLQGDWGGLALLGSAPTNADSPTLEGIADSEETAYGGDEPESSCGVIKYTRVEFAGHALRRDDELNGLTLAGCGSGTIVDYVQIHMASDDGLEIFGGTVDVRHVLVTRAEDDSLDWDQGWRGTAQFFAVQQDREGDNAIEASNSAVDPNAEPRSAPRIFNFTLVGSKKGGNQRAMTFKEGTGGRMFNGIVTGHPYEAVDLRGEATVAELEEGDLNLRYTLFYDVGSSGSHYFPTPKDEEELFDGDGRDDDGGFDEQAYFRGESLRNVFDVDPGLAEAYELSGPVLVPSSKDAVSGGIAPPPGFDESARYLGAFAPDEPAWTEGWTAYPGE